MVLLLLQVGSALAQSLEEREPTLPDEQEDKLQIEGGFETYWFEFDNLDFRLLDETSDQAILDSDDRSAFAYTGGEIELGYQIEDPTRFVMSASHLGLWGGDQFGNVNDYGGVFYFTQFNVEYEASETFKLTLGRMFMEIGGLGAGRDYALSDVVDQLKVDVALGEVGGLVLVPIEVVSSSGANEDANFYSYLGQMYEQTYGFRGDHMSRRHGAILTLSPGETIETAAYAYYTDIASVGSGSDISYEGLLGNFSDNDWTANVGIRGSGTFGPVMPYLALDASTGIDRKELVADDVDCNGVAVTAGMAFETGDEETGLRADLSFYQANGGTYGKDGLQDSHGYVSMKGKQVGGLVSNIFMGWHPSAYVGGYGVEDDPHEVDRKAGARVIAAEVGYEGLGPVTLEAGYWFLQDTGSSDVAFAQLDTLDPPYGYSREEFAAEQRLGKMLGQEIDVSVQAALTEKVRIGVLGGVLLPGEYYALEVSRVAGSQLGGQEAAWSVSGGTTVEF